jgi:hypothetical protein
MKSKRPRKPSIYTPHSTEMSHQDLRMPQKGDGAQGRSGNGGRRCFGDGLRHEEQMSGGKAGREGEEHTSDRTKRKAHVPMITPFDN